MRSLSLVRNATALAALACLALAPAAHAQFLGTQATGSLTFGGGGTNFFDPANGFVPVGPLNKTQGTTVTVADPATEFGFADGANTDTVNITGSTITLMDVSTSVAGASSFQITLTDTAFAGLTFNKVSDTFQGTGITFGRTGNTLSLNFAGGGGPFTGVAVFNLAPAVPEPGSVALLVGMGISGAGFLLRRRRK